MAHKITCQKCKRWISLYKRGLCWKCSFTLEMSGQLDSLYPTSKARQIEFLPGDYVREINEHPLWGEVCRTEEFDGLWYGRLDREMRVGVKMSITEGVVDLSPATLTKVDADEYHRRLDWIRNYYQPLANLASYVGR